MTELHEKRYGRECACGCGEYIIIKKYHSYAGIPNFISGHNSRNQKLSEEHKNKLIKSRLGSKHSEETKKIISEKLKGHKVIITKKQKEDISNSLKMWYKKNKKNKDYIKRCKKISETLKKKYKSGELIVKGVKGKLCSWKGKTKYNCKHLMKNSIKNKKNKIELYKSKKGQEIKHKIRLARAKQKFPKINSSIEIKMQNVLFKENIKYDTQRPLLKICLADLFIEPNIVIFCDGDYWHNYPHGLDKDHVQNKVLKENGYIVLRFWEHEINNNIEKCINIIKNNLNKKVIKNVL